jgi:hypothetical protein
VVNELLIELQKTGLSTYSYADDMAIVARGNFLSTLKELIEKALKIVQNWCQVKGLKVNPLKTETMIFTKKYKPEPIEPLRLWGTEIKYTSQVKYLRVHLDPKLNWKQHLEIKRTKFYSAFWACRRAMGKTWGLKPKVTLWLYKAVLLPRLTYAAIVWRSRVEKMKTRNLLKSLQGNYLRAAIEAMKTTPTEALEVVLCIPPLDKTIIYTARLTAYRLKCQGEWRGTGFRQSGLELLHKSPFNLKQDRIPKKHQLVKNFEVCTSTREN